MEDSIMQKWLALVLLVTASTANAAPIAGAGSVGAAVEADASVQTVACVRYGWRRGWGVYGGCYGRRYAPAYVVATPYYAPAPVYVGPPTYVRPPRRCWIDGAWLPC
jgi:hypothetical protein